MNKFQIEIANRNLEVEIGGLAERASGCVLARYGDTSVLSVCQLGEEKEEMGFLPLTCEYQERYYAAGKIKGPRFIKREGRPTDEAILSSRMIDRALRPRFPNELKRELQIITTCFSWDEENDPAVLGLLASSLSLLISEVPFEGPIAAIRIGKINDQFIINPTYQQREEGKLDLVFSAIEKQDALLINMIECKAEEISEDLICSAFEFAKPYLKKLIEFQKEIAQKIGKEKISLPSAFYEPKLEKEIKEFLEKDKKLDKALYQKDAQKRQKDLKLLKKELVLEILEKYPEGKEKQIIGLFEKILEDTLKKNIIERERRPDGRKLNELRQIEVKANILPRTHGSGFFSRDLTKVISILTLGGPHDQQLLEGMEVVGKKRFLHHYNFPSYSVGEVRPLRGPGRREIGHGILAEKALLPLIPSFDEFPYTIRIVSEILSSNGSTSMASVCSSCLALMDGGVPLKRIASGIAIGLIGGDSSSYKLLTDIQGPEDSYGEMDLKVAGTEVGITVLQMDVKIDGISVKILKEALEQAKKARLEILKKIKGVLNKPRENLSVWAPKVEMIQINPEKIGLVIGSGGRVINGMVQTFEVMIDIEETGKVFVTGENQESVKKAVERIKSLVAEAKIGEIYNGKVKRILDFGAFVEFLPGQEGLVHISQFTPERINKVSDVVKIGDIIKVKVTDIDELGRVNLSAKEAGFKLKR